MVGRIPEVTEINEPDQNTYYGYHFGEHVTKVVEFALQRRFVADLLGYRVVNVTYCGFGACESDDSTCGSIYDSSSLDKSEGGREGEGERERTEKSMLVISCLTALRSGTTSIYLETLLSGRSGPIWYAPVVL